MKKLIVFLIFSISIYAQESNVSMETNSMKGVVSATKMNVVYRGIRNPISIVVPNCKSFTATCPGLEKIDTSYYLSPGAGLFSTIKLTIILNDDSVITEEHKFRILAISSPIGTIDGRNCYNCIIEMTKEELINAEVNYKLDNFVFEYDKEYTTINGFTFNYSKNKKIIVSGNKFTNEINEIIKRLKIGSEIKISELQYSINYSGVCLPRILPIKIKIIEKEVNYFQSKEFIKDSLNAIKQEKKELRLSKKKKKL